jgi:ATP-dependent Clp protease ATP-binding subunit ClpA
LLRRTKKNLMFIGDLSVGTTAIAEGVAMHRHRG